MSEISTNGVGKQRESATKNKISKDKQECDSRRDTASKETSIFGRGCCRPELTVRGGLLPSYSKTQAKKMQIYFCLKSDPFSLYERSSSPAKSGGHRRRSGRNLSRLCGISCITVTHSYSPYISVLLLLIINNAIMGRLSASDRDMKENQTK